MTGNQYDAIVIGAGISGLGLSAFLAKAGRRVLTLEKTKAIGGRAYSFSYKGHTTNMGGPRAGLENGKVDGMFAALGKEPGERGFFDDVKTYRDGELIGLPRRRFVVACVPRQAPCGNPNTSQAFGPAQRCSLGSGFSSSSGASRSRRRRSNDATSS